MATALPQLAKTHWHNNI